MTEKQIKRMILRIAHTNYLIKCGKVGIDVEKKRMNRWRATWEHGGHQYECIFGYGVDPNESFWNKKDKRDAYNFTQTEFDIIDPWFNP